jgi:hypothetical protein
MNVNGWLVREAGMRSHNVDLDRPPRVLIDVVRVGLAERRSTPSGRIEIDETRPRGRLTHFLTSRR